MPGLWNIPASMFIYCMGRARSRWIPLHLRLERVRLGVEAAIRSKAYLLTGAASRESRVMLLDAFALLKRSFPTSRPCGRPARRYRL